MECSRCHELEKDGLEPGCKTAAGCPIGEEIAADFEVNQFFKQFLKIKKLFELNSSDILLYAGYQELELDQFPDELIKLETLYLEIKQKKSEETNTTRDKWNTILK